MVDDGSYTKNGNCGIFRHSIFKKTQENNKLNIPEDTLLPRTSNTMPHVLVTDKAFPLKWNLLRPYTGNLISGYDSKYHLAWTRRVSENVSGIFLRFGHTTKDCFQHHKWQISFFTIVILHNY
jgi:hypothetical protein